MTVKFLEKLSDNYLGLLDDKEDFNIIIKVGESPNTKIFQAHSAILRYRSLYFRNELANIRIFLLENHNASSIFELMLIAYEFLFDELAKYLEIHLIEKEAHWLRLNFTRTYQKSFENNKLQELQN
ncbi:hypothetical protein C2G38_2155880 [Gigaspora rosea]|uniref:BTB domain-containing protein n=1 Tax=Gigaspora rosea TaxID=44941 RepID=A0A397WBH5_9GLOM|nr:hypothetical protein C2G38_2155880 [Gigaspora rosea]